MEDGFLNEGRKMRRLGLVFVAVAALFGLGAAAEPAPALTVPTLAGPAFDLAAQRGHVVIVNFWATWCVPCRAEMPMLDAFYKKHQADGLVLLGLSVDSPSALPTVKKVAATVSYPIAVARDAQANGFPAANALPVTYVIDAAGQVKATLMPDEKGLSEEQLMALVGPLLKK
jgi:thiol-disulfide isomerase/thioredoxin